MSPSLMINLWLRILEVHEKLLCFLFIFESISMWQFSIKLDLRFLLLSHKSSFLLDLEFSFKSVFIILMNRGFGVKDVSLFVEFRHSSFPDSLEFVQVRFYWFNLFIWKLTLQLVADQSPHLFVIVSIEDL